MDVEIHPNAKKHLTEKQVLGAWFAVTECIRRESEDEPPRWLAIGWLPDGRSVELVAVELIRGWLIIHALVSGSEEILARDRASSAEGSMMSKTYTAANGQVVTDEMIDAWCESYERGEFPDGERTVGGIVHGRPPLSGEGTATLSVKIPLGMKEAIRRRAAAEGMTPSEFARAALSEKLLAAG